MLPASQQHNPDSSLLADKHKASPSAPNQQENPYPALLGWNETLDSSAAGQQITSAGAMHSHAGDLKTAYGKNNAYIGNYEAQL